MKNKIKIFKKIILIILVILSGYFTSTAFALYWSDVWFLNSAISSNRLINTNELIKIKNNLDYLKNNYWIRGGGLAQALYMNDLLIAQSVDGIKTRRVVLAAGSYLGNIGLDPDNGKMYLNHVVSIDQTKRILHSNGSITAKYSITEYSDINLKKNISIIENPIEKILKINGVSFDWKENNKKDIGVIAQNIEKVFPEVVITGSNGMKSVDYSRLVAPLIEAFKSQQKIIEKQEREIKNIKKKIKIINKE